VNESRKLHLLVDLINERNALCDALAKALDENRVMREQLQQHVTAVEKATQGVECLLQQNKS
jgi:hypothetical protein